MQKMETQFSTNTNINLSADDCQGDISVIKVVDFLRNKIAEDNFKSGLNAFVDLRKANLLFTSDQINIIVNLFKGMIKIEQRKIAIVTVTPDQTTVANYFESLAKRFPVDVRVFTNADYAKNWLRKKMDKKSLL